MLRRLVIVIPFATGGLPQRVMSCLGPSGARFMLLSTEEEIFARHSAYCTHFIHSGPQTDPQVLGQLLQLETHDAHPILLPVTTKGFEFVAEHRQILSARYRIPPISSLESLQLASDKWRVHELARRHGLPVLSSVLLTEDVIAAAARGDSEIRFPVLLKPGQKENGIGIRKVESADELSALQRQSPEITRDQSLLQTFVDGDDVSLSVYCEEGEIKAYTLWRQVVKSSIPFTIPTCIQFLEHREVLEIGQRLLKALRWQGVCDIDFVVDRQSAEIWILEINARFWGNVLACAKCGVNFALLMTQAARGSKRTIWPTQIDQAVFCYAKGAREGWRHPRVRRALLRHPLRSTALETVIRDPIPELNRVQAKLGRIWRRCIGQNEPPGSLP